MLVFTYFNITSNSVAPLAVMTALDLDIHAVHIFLRRPYDCTEMLACLHEPGLAAVYSTCTVLLVTVARVWTVSFSWL